MTATESEYRANLAGMNTFFGAVLGFVIADVKAPGSLAFGQFLLITGAIVISILYISASAYRLAYSALTVLFILALPRLLGDTVEVPDRLQVTLGVWAAMTVAVEYLPRRPDPEREPPVPPPA